mmetsp:Transcript_165591/g.531476  ORF Transcript_165591/g.531476 Transcript_165591/m.531476 type:complete len:266 (+) Transcript_165591:1229-2026(+)
MRSELCKSLSFSSSNRALSLVACSSFDNSCRLFSKVATSCRVLTSPVVRTSASSTSRIVSWRCAERSSSSNSTSVLSRRRPSTRKRVAASSSSRSRLRTSVRRRCTRSSPLRRSSSTSAPNCRERSVARCSNEVIRSSASESSPRARHSSASAAVCRELSARSRDPSSERKILASSAAALLTRCSSERSFHSSSSASRRTSMNSARQARSCVFSPLLCRWPLVWLATAAAARNVATSAAVVRRTDSSPVMDAPFALASQSSLCRV